MYTFTVILLPYHHSTLYLWFADLIFLISVDRIALLSYHGCLVFRMHIEICIYLKAIYH